MRIPNYVKRLITIGIVVGIFYYFRMNLLNMAVDVYAKYNVDGLLSEVVGGITTSLMIFVFYLFLIPIIEVSPKIVKYEDGSYCMKIYNSSFFAVYDVRAILTKVRMEKSANGKSNAVVDKIPINLNYMEYLPSMYNIKAHLGGNTFAIVHKITQEDEDVISTLSDKNNNTYYRLTITCKNGFTGLRKIKTENYTYKNSVIVDKEFASGATFKRI